MGSILDAGRGQTACRFTAVSKCAGELLISDYLDAWQARRSPFLTDGQVAEAADLHPSTWVHEESVIRCHLKPTFGTLRLGELTTSACKDFRKALQDKKLSGKQRPISSASCTRRWPMPWTTASSP